MYIHAVIFFKINNHYFYSSAMYCGFMHVVIFIYVHNLIGNIPVFSDIAIDDDSLVPLSAHH